VAEGFSVEVRLRFPGQYFDEETGLHQNWWRTYDSATGRYVRSDPIGLSAGFNSYLYAAANPLSAFDRLGMQTFFNNVSDNCSDTNRAIPGLILPVGVGILTAGVTAKGIGGITALGTIQFIGTGKFGGAVFFAGVTGAANVLLVGGVFQAGIFAGSLINAIPTRPCGRTVRDSVADGFEFVLG